MMQLLCLLVATTSALPVPSQSQQSQHPPPGYQPPQQGYQPPQQGYQPPQQAYPQSPYGQPQPSYGYQQQSYGQPMGGYGGYGGYGGGMMGAMGGMGGIGGMDPLTMMAMSQNGIGGGDLSSLLMGNPASLMASLIGGEGARDPSKGLENMLGLGTAMGGIDETE